MPYLKNINVFVLILPLVWWVVFARDVFESSEELVDRGVTEPSLNTWLAPKYAENVGECAKLCHLESNCLSFTINLDLNQCTVGTAIITILNNSVCRHDNNTFIFFWKCKKCKNQIFWYGVDKRLCDYI